MPDLSDELIFARINDTVRLCRQKNVPSFFGFLSETEIQKATLYLRSQPFTDKFGKDVRYVFFGGYDDAQRALFAALPDWAESENDVDFPIKVVRFSHNKGFSLAHRDYLGSLMALGITRQKVGDIIVDESGAFVFLHSDIAKHVTMQLDKIGRVGVSAEFSTADNIVFEQQYSDVSATIASNRLDCIVAALCRTSREKASALVESRIVFVNDVECSDTSKRLCENDKITIRKKGKFIIDSLGTTTKKGRTVLIARQKI